MLLFSKFRVSGHSMVPTINNNDLILATGILYIFKNPNVNDIVVFEYNNKVFVKRITKIIKNKYVVKGDNRNDSLDTRVIGSISKNNILGKVIYIFK